MKKLAVVIHWRSRLTIISATVYSAAIALLQLVFILGGSTYYPLKLDMFILLLSVSATLVTIGSWFPAASNIAQRLGRQEFSRSFAFATLVLVSVFILAFFAPTIIIPSVLYFAPEWIGLQGAATYMLGLEPLYKFILSETVASFAVATTALLTYVLH